MIEQFEEFVLTRDFAAVPGLAGNIECGLMMPADLTDKDVQRRLERWERYAIIGRENAKDFMLQRKREIEAADKESKGV